MVTSAAYRKLCLAQPEAVEQSHFEQPDFRVRKKIFATLSRDERQGVLKLSPETQAFLFDAFPQVFSGPGGWARSGWTAVDLAAVDAGLLAKLIGEAWRNVAPKGLVAQESTDPPIKARPAAPKSAVKKPQSPRSRPSPKAPRKKRKPG